jgi:hypothetical protein
MGSIIKWIFIGHVTLYVIAAAGVIIYGITTTKEHIQKEHPRKNKGKQQRQYN